MQRFAFPPEFKQETRAFLHLALPLASAQVAQAMTGFVDTLMMGRLGQEELAAGGLAVMIFTALLMTGISIVSSVSSLAAEAYGAQQLLRVGLIMRQGGWIVLLIALPCLSIMANLEGVMMTFGQEQTIITLADSYLEMARWGLLPALGFAVLRSTVTALSRAQPIFVIMAIANLLNVLGNYVFAFGKWGFPAMGLAGLALASTLAHTVMFLALLSYILWHRQSLFRPYGLFQSCHRLELRTIRKLLHIGLPVGVVTILENGLFTVMTFMMGALGTHVLAAQQLALQTIIIVFMIPLGMSYAATVRVGQWYGQKDWQGVRRAAQISVSLTIAVMLISGIFFVLFPEAIMRIYLDGQDPANQNVFQVGSMLLMVAGFGQVVDGVQRTANGVLQGLQDTRVPMFLSLVAYWGVGLVSGYWLGFHTSLGGVGIWIGAYLGLAVAAIAYIIRFRSLLATRSAALVEG